jgi:mRNA-degrading endonuclease RelE of RelBE toxin-antitoxin system
MSPKQIFQLIYAPLVRGHIKAIDPKYHLLIRNAIETQLQSEPDAETRNRKPLKRPIGIGAKWEIRFGPSNRFRVFYKIDHDNHQVHILAIGQKERNRLYIGKEEIEL